ncbi:NADH pyrophosphatase [Cladophialophora carrionii]|uniref:NAD(+) diphosphatase n=1 Tax=Cladophialophora carrionii TaxID=86049 RepID=A0A1C1CQJ2_9EURO|nr:NADH pyrophosphatase [Cladophialophora carrionii]
MSSPGSSANPSLSDIFGRGHNAYFSNGPITRLSFIRLNNQLLDRASTHPSARYLTFEELNPLRDPQGKLAFVSYDDVTDAMGRPYAQDEKTQIAAFDPDEHHPNVIFLGMDLEDQTATRTERAGVGGGGGEKVQLGEYTGVPYFALDVTSEHYAGFKQRLLQRPTTTQAGRSSHQLLLKHTPTRIDLTLDHAQAAIYSHARALLDWNTRNRYCSSCGGRTLSTHGGAKVVCPPADRGVARPRACPTRIGLHNQAFPRTDPTAVIAAVSADTKRVLLGRGKRWPANYFSCLSGFVEPGESIETATRREAYEETGVRVGHVQIHSSQPWPYPSTMLIGAIAQCEDGGETITYPETELEEARWFELAEVRHALDHGANPMWEPPPQGYTGPRVPPSRLMAHQVLRGVLRLFHR